MRCIVVCSLLGAGLMAVFGWSAGMTVPMYLAPEHFSASDRALQAVQGAGLGAIVGGVVGYILGFVFTPRINGNM
jgi:membrane protein YqaA with SNARE-associated domain